MDWGNPAIYIIPALALIGAIFAAGTWVGGMNSFKNTVGSSIEKISSSIDEIRDDIKKLFERLPATSITSGSPITLTELGKSISKEIEASDWAKNKVEEFLSDVQGKQPYEIQEISFEYVKEKFKPSDEFNRKMQECAYKNGVSIDGVKDVLAVELRDALLDRYHVG